MTARPESAEEDLQVTANDLERMTVRQLRKLASQRGLRGVHHLRKAELLARLRELEAPRPAMAVAEPAAAPAGSRAWWALLFQAGGWVGLVLTLAALVAAPWGLRWGADQLNAMSGQLAVGVGPVVDFSRAAAEGLGSAADALLEASSLISAADITLSTSQQALLDLSVLVGQEAPQTLRATQQALEAAQGGAQAIDGALRALAVLGPLTGVQYDPQRTLSASLQETAATLETLPGTLEQVSADLVGVAHEAEALKPGLQATGQDLQRLAVDLRTMAGELDGLANQLQQALAGLRSVPGALQRAVPWIIGGAELVLLWGLMVQLAVLQFGRHLAWHAQQGAE